MIAHGRLSGWLPVSVFALLLALLAGCAGPIRHDVTVFHEWPADLPEKSFRLVRKPDQPDTLENRTYERIVRDELVAAGFVESVTPVLQIAFDYDAKRRTVRYVDHEPVFSPYVSFGAYRHWGGVGFSGPLWWGSSYATTVREVDSYDRQLDLEMSDLRTSPPRQVYEASASSRGADRALAAALPLLMKAVLADFPGRSGVARSVDISVPEDFEASGADAAAPAADIASPAMGTSPASPSAPEDAEAAPGVLRPR